MPIEGWQSCTHSEKSSNLVVQHNPWLARLPRKGTGRHFLGLRHTVEQCEVSGREHANY